MTFCKVLIFGQPFNNFTGGGITLTNLFKGWPKDKIAVAYMGHGLYNVSTDVCDTVYQLGYEEHRWVFPFSVIQRKFPSGLKKYDPEKKPAFNFIQTGTRYKIVTRFFYPFLRWTGIYHFLSKIHISERFANFLKEFKPDLLYLQVSTRDEIIFSIDLIKHLKIPSIIHMMDDWPSTISRQGLFHKSIEKRIDRELKALFNVVDLHLSISDAMSSAYSERYKKNFIAFHNPIETSSWLPFRKNDYPIRKERVSVLYSGRIGMGITESIYEVAEAIDRMNLNGSKIDLHIQTPTKDEGILCQLRKYKCIIINPFAELSQLPMIFSNADILLLANDFSDHALDYLRLSMPTKASEYMVSGTPVLIYSPEETAVTKFFKENECGYCVTLQDQNEIIKAFEYLINNEEYRRKTGSRANEIARTRFSADKVRKEFQELLLAQLNK